MKLEERKAKLLEDINKLVEEFRSETELENIKIDYTSIPFIIKTKLGYDFIEGYETDLILTIS